MTSPYQPLPSPKDKLACIDVNQGKLVYEYFNGMLGVTAAHRFEEHLLLCFRCQDIVLSLDAIYEVLAEKNEEFFPEQGIEASKTPSRRITNSKRAKPKRG
jgi:hypothetical protein